MSRPSPVISVVIPTYNYARTLSRAAQSVLGQLDARSELLIIDDGSTDATSEVIEAIATSHPGQFRFISKSNAGPAATRNLGIAESQGEWLVFLDADDEMAEGALETLHDHIQLNPATRMIIGGHVSVFEDGRRRHHPADPVPKDELERVRAYLLEKRLALSNGACAMHREVFSGGGYPEQFRNSEDIPVFTQALARYPASRVDAVLAVIYKHNDSLRHHLGHGQAVGVQLVEEVFRRLPDSFQQLRKVFYVQRCLSLFRSAYVVSDRAAALCFFAEAYRADRTVLFKFSYSRKFLVMLLKGGRN